MNQKNSASKNGHNMLSEIVDNKELVMNLSYLGKHTVIYYFDKCSSFGAIYRKKILHDKTSSVLRFRANCVLSAFIHLNYYKVYLRHVQYK